MSPAVSRCRSCGAPIVWTVSPAGKKLPLDAEPVPHAYELLADGGTRAVEARVSHFRTCPDAGSWSKTTPKATQPTTITAT